MKKLSSLLIAALVATCAFAAVAATADTVKVKSSITIKFKDGGADPYDPYVEDTFTGKVKGKKGCKKGRAVKLIKQGGGVEGKATTDDKGFYDIPAAGASGNYFAKAKKKTIKKGDDKIKCAKAVSNTISVP